jgi:hypothetical protein
MTLTITLELTSEQEERLRKKALRAGLDVPGYLKHLADRSASSTRRGASAKATAEGQTTGSSTTTGAQVVAELTRQGIIGSGYGDPSIDAPELARRIRSEVWRVREANGSA